MGPCYLYVNRNKRSLCLDLKNPRARAALIEGGEDRRRLRACAAAAGDRRPRLGYEAIRKVKPDIVYVGAYGFLGRRSLTENCRPTTTPSRRASASPT
jgi:crotonobetainyl-CoA:carnitine CoA-transferase CaiB-like acyl-CoA transferase